MCFQAFAIAAAAGVLNNCFRRNDRDDRHCHHHRHEGRGIEPTMNIHDGCCPDRCGCGCNRHHRCDR